MMREFSLGRDKSPAALGADARAFVFPEKTFRVHLLVAGTSLATKSFERRRNKVHETTRRRLRATVAEFVLIGSDGLANVELEKLTLRATVLGRAIAQQAVALIPRGH